MVDELNIAEVVVGAAVVVMFVVFDVKVVVEVGSVSSSVLPVEVNELDETEVVVG